jgi:hypothetical protein
MPPVTSSPTPRLNSKNAMPGAMPDVLPLSTSTSVKPRPVEFSCPSPSLRLPTTDSLLQLTLVMVIRAQAPVVRPADTPVMKELPGQAKSYGVPLPLALPKACTIAVDRQVPAGTYRRANGEGKHRVVNSRQA